MNYENMLALKERIGSIDAGSWLDVAVGRGDFMKFAMGSFKSWNSVAGLDIDPESLELAQQAFINTPVILVMASALSMPFTGRYFDTVTMSNALHHIEDLPLLFSETARICKTNGLLIINEMLHEDNSEIEQSYMLYHKLISDIDIHRGHYHRETYTLKEMMTLISISEFHLVDYFIHAEETGNVLNKAEIEAISDRLRKKVASLKGSDYYYFYENKAREVINYFLRNGIHRPRHVTFIIQVQ
jgi:SAM-dependent methyltransferase